MAKFAYGKCNERVNQLCPRLLWAQRSSPFNGTRHQAWATKCRKEPGYKVLGNFCSIAPNLCLVSVSCGGDGVMGSWRIRSMTTMSCWITYCLCVLLDRVADRWLCSEPCVPANERVRVAPAHRGRSTIQYYLPLPPPRSTVQRAAPDSVRRRGGVSRARDPPSRWCAWTWTHGQTGGGDETSARGGTAAWLARERRRRLRTRPPGRPRGWARRRKRRESRGEPGVLM